MDARVQAITRETLTPLVQAALSDPAAQIANWQTSPVAGGWGGAVGGTALFRFSGQTEQNADWSLVLKILYARPGEDETAPYYWKREYELYRSRLLESLPDVGLTIPAFYGFAEYPDACWIWMEDIQFRQIPWTLADYSEVARRLGHFSGAYLTGLPIPDFPWLNINWHCRIQPPLADAFDHLEMHLQNPLIQRALPLDEKDTILSIWQERDRFCDVLVSLPQTLCHYDVFHRNLLRRDSDIVLIDWALAGRSAVGEDLVPLVALALYMPEISIPQAETLDQTVFASYITGLRDAGWNGDAQLARLGYTCAMTLRGLAGVKQDIGLLLDESRHDWLKGQHGKDHPDALADFYADIRRFRLIRMAKEARQLLSQRA
jgi:tRNA A-37 threonylcarbamoyl transferase component Bud32